MPLSLIEQGKYGWSMVSFLSPLNVSLNICLHFSKGTGILFIVSPSDGTYFPVKITLSLNESCEAFSSSRRTNSFPTIMFVVSLPPL